MYNFYYFDSWLWWALTRSILFPCYLVMNSSLSNYFDKAYHEAVSNQVASIELRSLARRRFRFLNSSIGFVNKTNKEKKNERTYIMQNGHWFQILVSKLKRQCAKWILTKTLFFFVQLVSTANISLTSTAQFIKCFPTNCKFSQPRISTT